MEGLEEFFGEVIYAYTRKQAIEDGQQHELNKLHPQACSRFKYPIYITNAAYGLLQEAAEGDKRFSLDALVYRVIAKALATVQAQRVDEQSDLLTFNIPLTGMQTTPDSMGIEYPLYTFLMACGATDIDNPAPCLTLMRPEDN